MKLATVQDVLARVNLSSTLASASPQSVESALEAATSLVESMLRTSLSETERIDYFDYTPSPFDSFVAPTLALTQRFLTVAPLVYFSENSNKVVPSSTTLISDANYTYSFVRGTVTVLVAPPSGYGTIAVKYVAGYTEGSSDIPLWLRNAAVSAAIYIQHTQAIAHSKKDIPNVSKVLYGILYSSINEYITTYYNSVPPSDSMVL